MSFTDFSHPVLTDVQDVALFPALSELTVAQAAKVLRMSEQHLNNLLSAGYIAFRQEDGERLIPLNGMLEYEQEQERSHIACDKLLRMFQEMGLSDD